jgi:hypothetical protein
MFDKNSKPTIIHINMPGSPTAGIIETPDGNLVVLSKNGSVYTINLAGEILSTRILLRDEEIFSFNDCETLIWVSTSKNNIYTLSPSFEILSHFKVESPVTSIAPIQDGSGLVLSYFESGKSWLEYRSLPDFKIISTCIRVSDLPIVSSVAFIYRKKMHFACCSKKGLHLYKETKKGIVYVREHSSTGGEVNFSQLLLRSKRFLVDNMTALVKTDLRPDRYVGKICFFRNFCAEHGAINQKNNWIAFLDPSVLKMIDYNTKETYKFETLEKKPSFVKILTHRVICGYDSNLYVYEFRSNSIRFIMEP